MEVHFNIRLLEFQYDARTMSVEFRFQFTIQSNLSYVTFQGNSLEYDLVR
jgi:hypothetical protein